MDIVEELRRDRESGAKRLVNEYKAGMMSLAMRFCADESSAEELVNATFAKVVANIDGYLEQSAFFAWMCQILTNLYRDSVKRTARKNEILSGDVPDMPDDDAREEIFRNVDHSLLRDAIETLPKEMKEAIMLHYIADQPIGVAARFLRLPVSTVKWRLHAARRELSRRLGAKVSETARKPGGKALLLALALACTAALGAAVWSLASGWGEPSRRADATWTGGTGETGETGATGEGTGATGGTGATDASPASPARPAGPFVPFVPFVPSVPDLSTPSAQENQNMNATTLRTFAASAAIAAASAVAETYTWDGGTPSATTTLGNGAITITCDAYGNVANLVAKPVAGETITIMGEDMVFADNATIEIATPDSADFASGALVFSNSVSAIGALALLRSDNAYALWSDPGNPLRNGAYATVATGVTGSASDWEVIKLISYSESNDYVNVSSIGYGGPYLPIPAQDSSVHTKNGMEYRVFVLNRFWAQRETCRTFSFRVALGFESSAPGTLKATLLTAYHSPVNVCLPKTDLYALYRGNEPEDSGYYGEYYGKGTYGGTGEQRKIDRLVARRVGSDVGVGFAGTATFGGAVNVGLGVTFAAMPGSGAFDAPVFTGLGDVEYRRSATLANPDYRKYAPFTTIVGDSSSTVVATVTGAESFPSNGIVFAGSGGAITLNPPSTLASSVGISGGKYELHALPGGEIRIPKTNSKVNAVNIDRQEVFIDGGTLWPAWPDEYSASANWNAARCYLPYLTLSGGGRIRGGWALWGNNRPQRWCVAGDGGPIPFVFDSIWGIPYQSKKTFTIVVSDLTGDAAADCVVSNDWPTYDYSDANYHYYTTDKKGDGTLRIEGSWAMRGTVTVHGGGVVFGDSGAPFAAGEATKARTSVEGRRNFALKDGALLGKTAGNLALDTLSVANGGTLSLGDSATISFADSSSIAWSGNLVIENFREMSVRFGTDANGITPAQVGLIRTDAGRHVTINGHGWLVFPGTMVIMR